MMIKYLIDIPEHIETVAKWNFDQWGYLSEGSEYDSFLKGTNWTAKKNQIPESFVVIEGNEAIASVSIVKQENEVRKDLSPWLSCLYVREDRRKQGVGKKLTDHVIVETAKLGFDTVYLEALLEHRDYYSKLGWRFLEMSKFKGVDVVIMFRKTRPESIDNITKTLNEN